MSRWVWVLCCALACALGLGLAGAVAAQQEPIDTQRFIPHATSDGFLMTEGSGVRFPVDPWSLGVWLHYGYNSLVIATDSELRRELVSTQLGGNLTGSYAIARWFELGLDVPFAYLSGELVSEAALGDLRLVPKFAFLSDRTDGLGLALIAEVRVPTHTSDLYGGARMVVAAPRLVIDHRWMGTGFRLGGSLGAILRESTQFLNVMAGQELTASVAAAYRFDMGFSPVELLFDLQAFIGLQQTDAEEVSLEALGAARIYFTPDLTLNIGAGVGVLEGFGTPTFRVLTGLRWEPSPNDPDRDGQPTTPPDGDPTYDEANEGRQGGQDGQGSQGGQGQDDEDPDAAEQRRREDAAKRGYDACPNEPEDFDGIEDDDGCPEGDEDEDGVLDMYDRCPTEAEVINGFEDEDGCPDEGPARVIVEDGRIVILETIRFKPNSDELEPESEPILNQVTLVLKARKDIKRVSIEGHTDNTGSREVNQRLSTDRAKSVRQYLIDRGVAPARLESRGFGQDKPIGDNKTDEGRAQNRRVEFIIVSGGKATKREEPKKDEPKKDDKKKDDSKKKDDKKKDEPKKKK
jgi:outer membrane protein OmpA-like peptidoglycan-associated protein